MAYLVLVQPSIFPYMALAQSYWQRCLLVSLGILERPFQIDRIGRYDSRSKGRIAASSSHIRMGGQLRTCLILQFGRKSSGARRWGGMQLLQVTGFRRLPALRRRGQHEGRWIQHVVGCRRALVEWAEAWAEGTWGTRCQDRLPYCQVGSWLCLSFYEEKCTNLETLLLPL